MGNWGHLRRVGKAKRSHDEDLGRSRVARVGSQLPTLRGLHWLGPEPQRRNAPGIHPSLRVGPSCGVCFVSRLANSPAICRAALRASIRMRKQRISRFSVNRPWQVWRVRLTAQRCESAAQLFLLPSVNATRFAHARSTQKSATGVYWNGVWQFLPGVVQAELRRRSR